MLKSSNRKYNYLITLAIILFGFIMLTLFVNYFPDSALDIGFTKRLQAHQNPFLDRLMKTVSWFGVLPYSAITVVATALIFLALRNKKECLFILLTLLSGVVSTVLKIIVNRPRPSQSLVHIMEKTRFQSFPSGHVLFYVMFYGMLVLIMRHHKNYSNLVRVPVTAISLFLIFTIPLSRIYLGAHWFTDVTAGFFAGLFCLAIMGYYYLLKKETAV